MKECKSSKLYKGTQAPKCNQGKGCAACRKIFANTVVANRNWGGTRFVLNDSYMLEQTKLHNIPHKGYKSDIARAFSGRPSVITHRQNVPKTYTNEWKVSHSFKSISIGCMTFEGPDYTKLKKWALS